MKQNEIFTSFLLTRDYIVEEVFDYYLQPEIQFAVYDMVSKQISYQPELQLEDGKVIKPIDNNVVREGKLLSSSAVDYIDEARLLEEIEEFIKYYLDLPHPFYLKLASHYILLTWVYDKLSVVPYLRALGDYGSGKTRFAQVVGSLCYKPLFVAGATSDAFIFRMIELFKGTMVMNELERANTDLQSQLVVILNNGYEKGMFIGRVEGDKKKEPRLFDVYSPKIITTRQKFKDLALESRILSIPMKPTKRRDIPVMLDESFWSGAQDIRNKLLMYRFKNLFMPKLESKEEKLWRVEPRLRQTLLPLFTVIQNEETEKEFVKYATEFQEQVVSDRSSETDFLVAEKLIDLLENNDRVIVKDVTEKVNKDLDQKEELTNKAVGQKIGSFGFKKKRINGVYQVVYNKEVVEYLKDRYGLNSEVVEESPLTPPSPPIDTNLNKDLGVIVDNGEYSSELDKST